MIFNSHTLWAWVVQGYLDWMFWSASSKRFEMSGRQAWIVNRKSERFLKISKGDNTNECLHKCHLLFSLTHKCNSLCLFKYSRTPPPNTHLFKTNLPFFVRRSCFAHSSFTANEQSYLKSLSHFNYQYQVYLVELLLCIQTPRRNQVHFILDHLLSFNM